jgi:hypothetical protein
LYCDHDVAERECWRCLEVLDVVCDPIGYENNSEQKRELPPCVVMQRVMVVSYQCFRTTIDPILRVQKKKKKKKKKHGPKKQT